MQDLFCRTSVKYFCVRNPRNKLAARRELQGPSPASSCKQKADLSEVVQNVPFLFREARSQVCHTEEEKVLVLHI